MKKPNLLQFVIREAEEGGYYAEAIGASIYTQGETIDETMRNIREAVDCHFGISASKNHTNLPILANFEIPSFA